jgi:hypothetical protein
MKTIEMKPEVTKVPRKKSLWYKLITTLQIIWLRVLGLNIRYRGYVLEYDKKLYQCIDPILKLSTGCVSLHEAKQFCKENKVGENVFSRRLLRNA